MDKTIIKVVTGNLEKAILMSPALARRYQRSAIVLIEELVKELEAHEAAQKTPSA